MPIIIDQAGFERSFLKGVTPSGKVVTPRFFDDNTATDIMPLQVVLTDTSGNPYAASSGSGTSNTVAATNAGTSAATANPVQGVTGGVPLPVGGSVSVSNLPVTQPISVVALPLPSGAATAAKQPAIGSAGTASTDVASIQGIAGMTPVKTDGSGVTQPISAASALAVTGTFWQSTQPVSLAALPALVAGSAAIGTVGVTALPALPAGTNAIGQVGGKTTTVDVTPTVTASSAYAANNIVGGVMTYSNVLLSAGTGILQSARLKIKSTQSGISFKLYLFKSNPTNGTYTDKTNFVLNTSDLPFVIGPFIFASGDTGGGPTLFPLSGIGEAVAPGSTTMYAILVTTGTPTFSATSDVTVTLGFLQD